MPVPFIGRKSDGDFQPMLLGLEVTVHGRSACGGGNQIEEEKGRNIRDRVSMERLEGACDQYQDKGKVEIENDLIRKHPHELHTVANYI